MANKSEHGFPIIYSWTRSRWCTKGEMFRILQGHPCCFSHFIATSKLLISLQNFCCHLSLIMITLGHSREEMQSCVLWKSIYWHHLSSANNLFLVQLPSRRCWEKGFHQNQIQKKNNFFAKMKKKKKFSMQQKAFLLTNKGQIPNKCRKDK